MSRNGFIKLHRAMTEWGWYNDPITKAVFLHLLLTAQWSPGEFKGYSLEPGQAVFGIYALAEKLGVSPQNIRTALKHLKSTNEITIKSTNKFSVATIVNWEKYQGLECEPNKQTNKQSNQQLTNNQQTTNNIKEYKNNKNERRYPYRGEDIKPSYYNEFKEDEPIEATQMPESTMALRDKLSTMFDAERKDDGH